MPSSAMSRISPSSSIVSGTAYSRINGPGPNDAFAPSPSTSPPPPRPSGTKSPFRESRKKFSLT